MATKKSSRQIKRKVLSEAEDSDSGAAKTEKKIRKCAKASCPSTVQICFARAASTCCGNGFTSRWYHITAGEHFCNECFEHFYRSHKEGYDRYISWKRLWTQYGNTDPSVRSFMIDQLLPYWVQCNLCEKWRSVFRETEISPKFLKNYVCTPILKNQSQDAACETPEDFRVELAKQIYVWPIHISSNQYLKNAIYAPYVRDYMLDAVGISPSDTSVHKYQDGIYEVREYLQPFQYDDENAALTLPPDRLSEDEMLYFPEFQGVYLRYYLIVRNTILVLWCLNVKNCVTQERCMNYMNMRGLSRVWITLHVDRILLYLTLKGHINCGLAQIPKHVSFVLPCHAQQKQPVIIIGAGIAGLAAARQLTNLGVQVTVLEAGPVLGGRAVDSVTSPFTTQSHMVIGSNNNPVVVMCKQADMQTTELRDSCVLMTESGEVIDDKLDKRMQFHFEAMLDTNKQLRKDQEKDISLLERFTQLHTQFKDESGIRFSKREESLLQFHISNLEFACGSNLGNISSVYWDQNEEYPQFQGPAVLVQDDVSKIVTCLADGIHIVKNCPVSAIDYTGQDITVTAADGLYHSSKVIVAVPLHVLATEKIKFTPVLPTDKDITLGCGNVEKVILKFPEPFWQEVVKNSTMFGHISSTEPGMFDVFYDISKEDEYMLSTFISGAAVETLQEKTDAEIITMCVQCLKCLFNKQTVGEPSQYYVSRWYQQPHVAMSYSYIPTNCGADAFTNMERDVDEKIYFAGEATHVQFPQTLTGAYMSGLREAEKIYRSLVDIT